MSMLKDVDGMAGHSQADPQQGRNDHSCDACRSGVASVPLTMAFQPIVDVEEQRIDAFEALVRGLGGEGAGHVLGQVNADNLYAFDQTCRVKAIELAARLGITCRLNINFLPNAVYQPRACIRATLEAAARTGFPTHLLTFEIVETQDIADVSHLLNIVREYRRQGFSLALDDFGTGHSGFARLAALRPDIVKVDRILVQGCDRDAHRLAIIASLIGLGHATGIKIVLEGMETAAEVAALRSVGGRYMQGFYFARPLFEGITDAQTIFGRIMAGPGA
jgi:EAL domain-containing protein (putative c-di-GMP-specific phosphodiesterase class I)